jgi:predicted TIM-barrel fold metal-dependent hydrolase
MTVKMDPYKYEESYLQDGFYDADAHIMEPLDWLEKHIDESIKGKLFEMPTKSVGGAIGELVKLAEKGAHPADKVSELEKDILSGPKGYAALGAFNAEERSRTLDLLNIKGQLIFTTFAGLQFAHSKDDDVLYGGLRAHNKAMAEWCGSDERLHGVAVTNFRDEDKGFEEAKWALENGCRTVMTGTSPFGDKSPGHPDFDPFWRLLEEHKAPFILHIGVHNIRKPYTNNGEDNSLSFNGAGEGIRAKDFTIVNHWPEQFLTALILDGVLERFPDLRIGVIEYGADWVPSFMRRLDHAHRAFSKSEPYLKKISRKPSQQIEDQVRVTPYVFEDVGLLIKSSSDRIYMFSTDYPHFEGGKAPVERMDATMEDIPVESKARYYRTNYLDLLGC